LADEGSAEMSLDQQQQRFKRMETCSLVHPLLENKEGRTLKFIKKKKKKTSDLVQIARSLHNSFMQK
jgi:hypothetical protein